MKRIGIAASKMAKGNLVLYNAYVVLISFLFSLFIFIVAGVSVVFALIIISYVASEAASFDFDGEGFSISTICMISLTIVIFLLNLFALLTNIKFSKNVHKRTNENDQ